jgi:hypothetical protein
MSIGLFTTSTLLSRTLQQIHKNFGRGACAREPSSVFALLREKDLGHADVEHEQHEAQRGHEQAIDLRKTPIVSAAILG